MENVIWLAIKSGEDSTIPALVRNNQLVEDANWPHGWRYVSWYDPRNPWHCGECWMPSTMVLEAFQLCTDLSDMD